MAAWKFVSVAAAALIMLGGAAASMAKAQNRLSDCPDDVSVTWHNCYGTYTFVDGDTYVGEFKDYNFNGQGTYTFADGETYVGEFKDGYYNGQGTYTFADGSKYAGEWRDSKANGPLEVTYANGDTFVGAYTNDKRNGEGTYTWSDGSSYVGAFKDGLPSGAGSHRSARGVVLTGVRYSDAGEYDGDGYMTSPDVLTYEAPVQVATATPGAERKVALVIGNEAYEQTVPLDNPLNDARAMSAMLQQLGFEVLSGTDLNKVGMERTIRDFVREARTADISLFFYAGHAIQVAGHNYLVPVDAAVRDETALDFELVNTAMVTNYMTGNDRVGIVLLDACRDNPLSRSLSRSLGSRSSEVGRGLAPMSSIGGGLLVAYATAPGDVASDGKGDHSPFTAALLKYLPTPGMDIQWVMTRVKREVVDTTGNEQRPWTNSDLVRDVILLQAQ